ncbi:MAG TPA: zinc ribbon domain-containing protein [Halioglobus sp.]
MPIYEYQCQACHEQLEILQKISDQPLLDCPKCGEPALKKMVSAAAFRLKGGGWYETDFKTGNKKNLVTGGDTASGGDKSTASSASESKSGESKSSENKAGDSKTSNSKSGDSKKTA